MSEKTLKHIILKSNNLNSLQDKINEHVDEGYECVGGHQVTIDNIEIQRAGTFHHYRHEYSQSMKLKDE